MKLLFDLLDSSPEPDSHACIARSLDQLAAVQYLSDPLAPPGILNFGLPRAADVPIGVAGGDAYAALVQERIAHFEPRLAGVRAQFEAGKVHVTAKVRGAEDSAFDWRLGGSSDRE